MPIDPREPEELAEEIMEEADQDMSVDDLTRGTEVYLEGDDDVEEHEEEIEELDFEPGQSDDDRLTFLDFDDAVYTGEED